MQAIAKHTFFLESNNKNVKIIEIMPHVFDVPGICEVPSAEGLFLVLTKEEAIKLTDLVASDYLVTGNQSETARLRVIWLTDYENDNFEEKIETVDGIDFIIYRINHTNHIHRYMHSI